MRTTLPPLPFPSSQSKSHRASFVLLSLLLVSGGGAFAQNVGVSGAAAASNGSYVTLGAAFAAINGADQTGNTILVEVVGDTDEPGIAALDAGNWTTLTVRPNGVRRIGGTLSSPVIDLNGVSRVIIDGRRAGGDTLTIVNFSADNSVGTSTIRFRSDARGNTVTNCLLLGSSTTTNTVEGGTVLFTAGATTGTDDNTVSNCEIAPAGIILPTKAVHSVGTTTALAAHNSGNVLVNNTIRDFWSDAGASRGVLLGPGNAEWRIEGNRFHHTAERVASASPTHRMVEVAAGSDAGAGGHRIVGNTFGTDGAAGNTVISGGASTFRAIFLDVPNTAPESRIARNAIKGISCASTATGTGAAAPMSLIFINSGRVAVDSNTIGDMTTPGSIVFTPSATGRHFHAVYNHGGSELNTTGNEVGGITFAQSGSLYVLASSSQGGTIWNCERNTIGGVAAASIGMTGTGTNAIVHGVFGNVATITATDNLVRHLSSAGTGSGGVVSGFNVNASSLTARNNTVRDLVGARDVRAFNGTNASTIDAVGNTITLLTTSSSTSGVSVTAFATTAGNLTVTGNTVVTFRSAREAIGVLATNGATVSLTGNSFEDLLSSSTTSGVAVNGISASGSTIIAERNLFRGLTCGRNVNGVLATNTSSLTLTDNTFSDFSSSSTTSGAIVRGINAASSNVTATGNRFFRLSGAGPGADATAGVVGIAIDGGQPIVNLVANDIHTLEQTNASAATQVTGIRLSHGGSSIVERNFVHSLFMRTTSVAAGALVRGIAVVNGEAKLRNNMVRLGIGPGGNPLSGGHAIRGVDVTGGTCSVQHNSVYIGGSGVTSANHTHALFSTVVLSRDYRNNILWNARSSAGGNGRHYAIATEGDPQGNLVSDHNCLRVTGSANGITVLGNFATADVPDLDAWRSITGLDPNSFVEDPRFIDAEGDTALVDLHIHPTDPTPIEGRGVLIPEVVDDFDGDIRAGLTPVDVGADAGDFVLLVGIDGHDARSTWFRWLGQEANGTHVVRTDGATLLGWEALDATGRTVGVSGGPATGDMHRIPLGPALSGTYLLRLHTDRGIAVLRVLHVRD